MTEPELKLSVPKRVRGTPRDLTAEEWVVLEAVADILIPAYGASPAASMAPDFRSWARRALTARAEHFDTIGEALRDLGGLVSDATALRAGLRSMSTEQPEHFAVLSSVIAGAYVMVPLVKEQIGYPGQGGAAPRVDEAAEQLEDGILDPVIARGPIYASAAGE